MSLVSSKQSPTISFGAVNNGAGVPLICSSGSTSGVGRNASRKNVCHSLLSTEGFGVLWNPPSGIGGVSGVSGKCSIVFEQVVETELMS